MKFDFKMKFVDIYKEIRQPGGDENDTFGGDWKIMQW